MRAGLRSIAIIVWHPLSFAAYATVLILLPRNQSFIIATNHDSRKPDTT